MAALFGIVFGLIVYGLVSLVFKNREKGVPGWAWFLATLIVLTSYKLADLYENQYAELKREAQSAEVRRAPVTTKIAESSQDYSINNKFGLSCVYTKRNNDLLQAELLPKPEQVVWHFEGESVKALRPLSLPDDRWELKITEKEIGSAEKPTVYILEDLSDKKTYKLIISEADTKRELNGILVELDPEPHWWLGKCERV